MQAENLRIYNEAKRKGEQDCRREEAAGRFPFLPALDDMLGGDNTLAEIRVGVMEIPIERIAGTKTAGRQEAFSRHFYPLLEPSSEFAVKWMNLYEAQETEGIRDPVKVYEYMTYFFVEEGNKRVSVASYFEMETIAAEVIRVLPKRSEAPEVKQYFEFLKFFEVFPSYEIQISEPGGYDKFAALFGQNLTDVWDDELRRRVVNSFSSFKKVFDKKGGSRLAVSAGDAFSLYVKMYGKNDSAAFIPEKLLSKRVDKLWEEYEFSAGEGVTKSIEESTEEDAAAVKTTGLFRTPVYSEAKPLRIAFFYRGSTENSRVTRDHELGRQHVDEHFGGIVRTSIYENIKTEEDLRGAIDAAAAEGNVLFFTTSPAMKEETLRAAIHYPKLHFLNCSMGGSSNAVRSYYGKMYEAKFVLGALAASLSESHTVGYIGSYPSFAIMANINAFALGAALVDPGMRIRLLWATEKDTDFAAELQDARIISGSVSVNPVEPTREYGLYNIREQGDIGNLALPVWNWGQYYERIIRSFLTGSYEKLQTEKTAIRYFYGFSSHVIDIVLSEKLSYRSHKLVASLKQAISAGALHPFGGEIHSQKGLIQAEGRLDENAIIGMNWLNDNIDGRVPSLDALEVSEEGIQDLEGVVSGEDTDGR